MDSPVECLGELDTTGEAVLIVAKLKSSRHAAALEQCGCLDHQATDALLTYRSRWMSFSGEVVSSELSHMPCGPFLPSRQSDSAKLRLCACGVEMTL